MNCNFNSNCFCVQVSSPASLPLRPEVATVQPNKRRLVHFPNESIRMTSVYSWVGHRGREFLAVCAPPRSACCARPPPCSLPRRRVDGKCLRSSGDGSRERAPACRLARNGCTFAARTRTTVTYRPCRAAGRYSSLHQSRHPLNRPRYYPNIPCVFDADDADILDPRCRQDVIECCTDSVAVIAGSRFLANEFRLYNHQVKIVWTGTYLKPSARMVPSQLRLPSVAWATTDPVGMLHEAELVREVIVRLAQKVQFTFLLYGVRPDWQDAVEAYLAPIRRVGVPVQTIPPLPYKQFVRSLESVAVGLQPVCVESQFSRGRSFGKLLAYMIADVAIVASDAVDNPLFFRDGVNGVLAPNDVDRWVEGTTLLLQNPTQRSRMIANARSSLQARLTTEVSAQLVGKVLLDAIEDGAKSAAVNKSATPSPVYPPSRTPA